MKKLFILDEIDFCIAKKKWIKKNINKVNNLSDSNFIRDLIKSYLGEKTNG